MTAFRKISTWIAAVGVCLAMLAGGAANAQISGRVIGTDLSALENAHVELWESYPDGPKVDAIFSEADGSFSFSVLTGDTYDIRVWKANGTTEHFPSVVYNIPQSYSGLLLIGLPDVPELPGLNPEDNQPTWCDFSDIWTISTFRGYPIQRGDVVGVTDPDDVWCGMLTSSNAGTEGGYFVHVYADDTDPLVDRGADPGDILTFFINNKSAQPVNSAGEDTVGVWQKGSNYLGLVGTSFDIEGVTITPPPDQLIAPATTYHIDFRITNTGTPSDSYDLRAVSQHGWDVFLPGGAVSGSLNPGESEVVTVRVDVPIDISADSIDYVYLFATSQANFAIMDVDRGLLDAKTTAIFDEEVGVPDRYFLAQNYPNPFNPSTTIAYGLEAGGHTTVTVYNLLGQQVALVLDEYKPAGNHVATWDGHDHNGLSVPSGIYFYRIQSGLFKQTRKMVLLK